jgi:ATP-binding cassette, subfamily B, bacterial
MILSFYGRGISLREARRLLDPGRDGTTARALAVSARGLGVRVKALSAGVEELGAVPCPAILHWRAAHFVVLERWTPDRATIVDPARGRVVIPEGELRRAYTGVALTFEGGPTRSSRATWEGEPRWRPYLRELAVLRGEVGVLLGCSLLLQLVGLVIPALTAFVVDRVIPAGSQLSVLLLAALACLLVVNQFVMSTVRERFLVYLRARLDEAFTTRFVEHLLSLPLAFFERRGTGDLLGRIYGNAAIRDALSSQAIGATLDGGLVLGYLVIIFALDVRFGLLVLIIGTIQAVAFSLMITRTNLLLRRELAARAETQNFAVQALGGIVTLKASGSERRAFRAWADRFAVELRETVAVNRAHASLTTVSSTLGLGVPLALLLFGAYQVIAGAMTIGAMFALIALASALLAPLMSMITTAVQVQRASAYLDRLTDVLAAEPEGEIMPGRLKRPISGAVELKRVSFCYQADGPQILRDVTLAIAAGETVGVAGRSGSGKTTLAKLILGLYLPAKGAILYDGVALSEYDVRELRTHFGVVMQDPAVFAGTLRDNIAFHEPDMPVERVIEAATVAELHDDITRMPLGYSTPVGDGGGLLSGGQLQRLALARALAARPRVLLLDEATSHLDAVTEKAITANLTRLSCTRIVIAHRLSTIRNADRIIVLDAGTIVEEGAHTELLSLDGHYARLIHSQLEHERAAA